MASPLPFIKDSKDGKMSQSSFQGAPHLPASTSTGADGGMSPVLSLPIASPIARVFSGSAGIEQAIPTAPIVSEVECNSLGSMAAIDRVASLPAPSSRLTTYTSAAALADGGGFAHGDGHHHAAWANDGGLPDDRSSFTDTQLLDATATVDVTYVHPRLVPSDGSRPASDMATSASRPAPAYLGTNPTLWDEFQRYEMFLRMKQQHSRTMEVIENKHDFVTPPPSFPSFRDGHSSQTT